MRNLVLHNCWGLLLFLVLVPDLCAKSIFIKVTDSNKTVIKNATVELTDQEGNAHLIPFNPKSSCYDVTNAFIMFTGIRIFHPEYRTIHMQWATLPPIDTLKYVLRPEGYPFILKHSYENLIPYTDRVEIEFQSRTDSASYRLVDSLGLVRVIDEELHKAVYMKKDRQPFDPLHSPEIILLRQRTQIVKHVWILYRVYPYTVYTDPNDTSRHWKVPQLIMYENIVGITCRTQDSSITGKLISFLGLVEIYRDPKEQPGAISYLGLYKLPECCVFNGWDVVDFLLNNGIYKASLQPGGELIKTD